MSPEQLRKANELTDKIEEAKKKVVKETSWNVNFQGRYLNEKDPLEEKVLRQCRRVAVEIYQAELARLEREFANL